MIALIPFVEVGGKDVRAGDLAGRPELLELVRSHVGLDKAGEVTGSWLEGGVAVEGPGWRIERPDCCSDLAALLRWEEAVRERPANWVFAGGGHDGVYIRYENGGFTLTDLTEVEASGELPPIASGIPAEELTAAVERALAEVNQLRTAVREALAELGYADAPWVLGNVIGF